MTVKDGPNTESGSLSQLLNLDSQNAAGWMARWDKETGFTWMSWGLLDAQG